MKIESLSLALTYFIRDVQRLSSYIRRYTCRVHDWSRNDIVITLCYVVKDRRDQFNKTEFVSFCVQEEGQTNKAETTAGLRERKSRCTLTFEGL